MTEHGIARLAERLLAAPEGRWQDEYRALASADQRRAVRGAMCDRAEVNRREIAKHEQQIEQQMDALGQGELQVGVSEWLLDGDTVEDWHLDSILTSRQVIVQRREILDRIERWLEVCR